MSCLAELAFYADVAAVLFEDAVTDLEAKPRPFAHLFSGEERIESP